MKSNRFVLIAALVLLATLLSACGGSPAAATWPGLAADENAAYLTNGAIVYAIRVKDGEELWRFPDKPSSKLLFNSNPVFTSDGQLLVGSSGADHTLFRIDPETGNENWSFSDADDHWAASPLVVGDMVYAPNADGFLYVFDLSQDDADKFVTKVELGGKLWSQPVSDGTRVYVPSLDHQLHAVNMQTYQVEWSTQLDGAITGAPARHDGTLYIGTFGQTMNAVNASDGSIAWSQPVKSWVWGGPLLDNGILYFGDLGGNFYALNASDGSPVFDSIQPDNAILATPILFNGQVVFVSESGNVYSLAPGETALSIERLDGKLYTPAALSGELILAAPFQSEGGILLVALNMDGKIAWSFAPEK
ncbi:MAG: Outer membrane protein assembly factor BamB [Anaerolineales bacterium]|nr:Outer membrane protein assembly factor BamB [Anaerolineales bacterium]